MNAPPPRPPRLAAAYYLAFATVALIVLAIARGAGRIVIPLLLALALGALLVRVVRALLRPPPP